LTWNPPISIANLRETTKEGVYVVGGIVDGLVDPEKWWYAACSCNASVSANSGAYYCHDCVKHVSKMIPRSDFLIYLFLVFTNNKNGHLRLLPNYKLGLR
jgi:hypothetical protein